MKIPKILAEKGVTEHDVLESNSNTYTPGFMQIYLRRSFPGKIKDMEDVQAQGSFLHEYIHYLQNITTPWGLYSSMVTYLRMVDTFKYIQETDVDIELPLTLDYGAKACRESEILSLGNGTNPFEEVPGSHVIDRSKKIVWHRNIKEIQGKKYQYIDLDIHCLDAEKHVRLGAFMIKESMAAMYQMQYDHTATHPDNDLPYNLIKIIAEQSFPNICNDDKKLITICYLSLFSLSPAVVLLEQLDFANQNPDIPSKVLLDDFIEKSKISINGADLVPVKVFFEDLVNRFEHILSKSLLQELDYIHESLSRIRLSKGVVPIIDTLYDSNFGEGTIQDLLDYVGVPYIYTINHEYHYPESVKTPGAPSNDMVSLIGMHAIYNYIVFPNEYRCCPLRYMCLNTDFDKDECFDAPWLGHECVMTVMGKLIGLDKKTIRWKKEC